MSKRIPLSKGKWAIVDDADYEVLSRHSWHFRNGYAARNVPQRKASGRWGQVVVYMQRVILGAPDGMRVNYINSDRLDNRRSNLRLCTQSQIVQQRPSLGGCSQFKGVLQQQGHWMARLKEGDKVHASRYYDNEEDAARAYDRLAIRHHSAYAALNFEDSRTFDWATFDIRTEKVRAKRRSENSHAQDYSSQRKSKYRGVHSAGNAGGWIVRITKGGVVHYGGHFTAAPEAARRYDALARELYGEAAVLNFG